MAGCDGWGFCVGHKTCGSDVLYRIALGAVYSMGQWQSVSGARIDEQRFLDMHVRRLKS